MVRLNQRQKFLEAENCHMFSCTLVSVHRQMSLIFQVLTASMVTYSFPHVFAILERGLTLGLSSYFFSSRMFSINFTRACGQSNVYVLLLFAKYFISALFTEIRPIAIVVKLLTTHPVKNRSQHRFIVKRNQYSERFSSLENLATLRNAGRDSDNVFV